MRMVIRPASLLELLQLEVLVARRNRDPDQADPAEAAVEVPRAELVEATECTCHQLDSVFPSSHFISISCIHILFVLMHQ